MELAADGGGALASAARRCPDAVLLDLGLPDIDGQDVINQLRTWTTIPIVVLSAKATKPAKSMRSTPARTTTSPNPSASKNSSPGSAFALRRHQPLHERPILTTGHFAIDLVQHTVTKTDGTAIRLTPIEWRLLEHLARHPNRLVTQRQLLQAVWGPQYEQETNYLRVHLTHLRQKIEPEPRLPRYITTDPGVGYRFHLDNNDSGDEL